MPHFILSTDDLSQHELSIHITKMKLTYLYLSKCSNSYFRRQYHRFSICATNLERKIWEYQFVGLVCFRFFLKQIASCISCYVLFIAYKTLLRYSFQKQFSDINSPFSVLTVPIFERVNVPPVRSFVPSWPAEPKDCRRFNSEAISNTLQT